MVDKRRITIINHKLPLYEKGSYVITKVKVPHTYGIDEDQIIPENHLETSTGKVAVNQSSNNQAGDSEGKFSGIQPRGPNEKAGKPTIKSLGSAVATSGHTLVLFLTQFVTSFAVITRF